MRLVDVSNVSMWENEKCLRPFLYLEITWIDLKIALIFLRNLEPILEKISFKTNASIPFSIRTLLSSDYVNHSTLGWNSTFLTVKEVLFSNRATWLLSAGTLYLFHNCLVFKSWILCRYFAENSVISNGIFPVRWLICSREKKNKRYIHASTECLINEWTSESMSHLYVICDLESVLMHAHICLGKVTNKLSESYQDNHGSGFDCEGARQIPRLMRWVSDGMTDLRLRGTVALSPDDRALLLSSPTPPAFSTTQPEHALGPNTDTEVLLKLPTQHLTGVIITNQVSNEGIFPLR